MRSAPTANSARCILGGGHAEGRTTTFDADSYLAANADLRTAFGTNTALAARHYITNGRFEGRPTSGYDAGPAPKAVSEGSTDLTAGTSTAGYVGVGQSDAGRIGSSTDHDWFRTSLTAGQTVIVEARGSAGGGGTLYDPDVYLRNASGRLVAYNWDSGAGYDARLVYRAAQSATFCIDVDGCSIYQGSYTVSVTASSSSRAVTAPLAEFLDRGATHDPGEGVDLAGAGGYTSSIDGFL